MWRILNVDWYEDGLLEHKARKIVKDFYYPMIPIRLYWMLEHKQFKRIIRGFTLNG